MDDETPFGTGTAGSAIELTSVLTCPVCGHDTADDSGPEQSLVVHDQALQSRGL